MLNCPGSNDDDAASDKEMRCSSFFSLLGSSTTDCTAPWHSPLYSSSWWTSFLTSLATLATLIMVDQLGHPGSGHHDHPWPTWPLWQWPSWSSCKACWNYVDRQSSQIYQIYTKCQKKLQFSNKEIWGERVKAQFNVQQQCVAGMCEPKCRHLLWSAL